jgi:hypothetical protein
MPGHKNSQGLDAPWVIKSHETGKILSSHKSKKEAEKHLYKDMQGHKKSSLEPDLSNNSDVYKEISIFYRLCSDKDKPQMIDLVKKKFNVTEEFSERVFNEIFPNGLKFVSKTKNNTSSNTNESTKKRIHSNIEKVVKNIKDFDITDKFIEDLYEVVSKKQDIDDIVNKYGIRDDAFVLVLYSLLEELHDIISKK